MKIFRLDWTLTDTPVPLREEQVHVWRIHLDRAADPSAAGLSGEEKARAARFRFDHDRRRFTAAHAALRAILAGYLHLQPQEVQFITNSYGKPYLAGGQSLFFNLSHSHELALLAVTERREVGADVEYLRPELVEDAVIQRYFALAEARELFGLSADMQVDAFFNIWTRKEALIKARGMGLSLPLDQFVVPAHPHDGQVRLISEAEPELESLWSIQAFHPAAGYAAAVAGYGQDWELVGFEWIGGKPAETPPAEHGEDL